MVKKSKLLIGLAVILCLSLVFSQTYVPLWAVQESVNLDVPSQEDTQSSEETLDEPIDEEATEAQNTVSTTVEESYLEPSQESKTATSVADNTTNSEDTPESGNPFDPTGPLREKISRSFASAIAPAAADFTLGGGSGDYLYLVYDRGDTAVRYPNLATVEVFKTDALGSGTWKNQYYDKNSSGVSIYYTVNGVVKHYVTPYFTTWASSSGTQLKDSDAVVTKPNNNTISVKWTMAEFSFEMRYIYSSGSLSLQREFYFTNLTSKSMSNIKVIYGGDTFFSGNDYGYSYWDAQTNMVYVRSSSANSAYMGLSGNSSSPASAYYAGRYNTGAGYADQGALPNTVTSSNVDQSYYLQWNQGSLGAGASYNTAATERFSLGGSVQILSPQSQTIDSPSSSTQLQYNFLVSNVDNSNSASVSFTAASSRGYTLSVQPDSYNIPAGNQKSVKVTVTVPANASVGDDIITLTGTLAGTTVKSIATAVTTIRTPPDTVAPVISTPTYLKNTSWVKTNETVSFTVTDNVAVNVADVIVTSPGGAVVPVTIGAGNSYSFVASSGGIYSIDAKDTSGNKATTTYTKTINIDNNNPVISAIKIAPQGSTDYQDITQTLNYSCFTKQSSEITVSLADSESGVKTLLYQFISDGGSISESAWTTVDFGNPLQLKNYTFAAQPNYADAPEVEFIGAVALRIVDGVGNISTSVSDTQGKFISENKLPTVNLVPEINNFDPNSWYQSIPFSISAEDMQSGIKRVEVLVNGNVTFTDSPAVLSTGRGAQSYLGSYTFQGNGVYSLVLRVTDFSGNQVQTASQTVKVSNQTPILTLSSTSEDLWTKENVTILLANSNSSVVEPYTFYYQKQGETNWTAISTVNPGISSTFTITDSVNSLYSFKCITASGLSSNLMTSAVKVDKITPLSATVQVNALGAVTPDTPDGENGWYISIPTIVITPAAVEDSPASPSKVYYKFALASEFSGASPVEFTGSNSPVITEQGIYSLEVYSLDAAGNRSLVTTRSIEVDLENPLIGAVSLSRINLADLTGFWDIYQLFSGDVKVSASVTDSMSGLYNVYYQLVPEGSSFNPSGPFTLAGRSGSDYYVTVSPQYKGRVYLAVKDISGRTKTLASMPFVADALPPTTPVVSASRYEGSNNLGAYTDNTWTADEVKITVDQSEALSGIKAYYYRLNDGPLELMPAEGITAPSNAISQYKFYSANPLSNEDNSLLVLSSPASLRVKNDSTPPTLTADVVDTAPISRDAEVSLSYSVGLSGLASITVSLDGGAPIDLSPRFSGGTQATIKLPVNGSYVFTVTDTLGRTATKTRVVSVIDRIAPLTPGFTVLPGVINPLGQEPYRTEAQVITVVPTVQDIGSTVTTYLRLRHNQAVVYEGVYASPITVDENGEYQLEVWAQDAAGNLSTVGSSTWQIDMTVPQLDFTFTKTLVNGVYEDFTEGTVTASDAESGISFIQAILDSDQVGVSDITLPVLLTDGEGYLRIPATFSGVLRITTRDKAGNQQVLTTPAFQVVTSRVITRAQAISPSDYQGEWTSSGVQYRLYTDPLPEYTTILGYEVSTDGLVWSQPANLVFQAMDQTATFSLSQNQQNLYYFRAITRYDDGILQEQRNAVRTQGFLTQIDTQLPWGTITVTGQEVTSGLYSQAPTVSTTVGDSLSGVAEVSYSLDQGNTWSTYSGAFTIAPQYKGTVRLRVIDKAGNSYSLTSNQVWVDNSVPVAPIIRGSIEGQPYDLGWTASPVDLVFSGGDNTDPLFSGISTYQFSLDGGTTWTEGTGVTITQAGVSNIRVRAISRSGITGPIALYTVKRDPVVPDIQVSLTPGSEWTKDSPLFTLSTTKTYNSPYSYEYKLHASDTWLPLTGNTLQITDSGIYSYDFRLVTAVASAESLSNEVKVDKVAPMVAQSNITGQMGLNNWYKAIPTIAASEVIEDVDHVVRSPITTYYSLYASGSNPLPYGTTVPAISGDGTYILDLKTVDGVNKETFTDSQVIKVDGTAPQMAEIAFNPMASNHIFNQSVQVLLQAFDATSGIISIEYKIVPEGENEADLPWHSYSLLYVETNFRGTIYARSTDRAGNISSVVSKKIVIDLDPPGLPLLSASTASGSYTPETWTSENVKITINDPEPAPVSGIDHYQVNDGSGWRDLAFGERSFNVTNLGVNRCQVRTVAGTGIIGSSAFIEVWIDNTVPNLQIGASYQDDNSTYSGEWTNRDVRITLSNTGVNPSGVDYYNAGSGVPFLINNIIDLTADTPSAGLLLAYYAQNKATPSLMSSSKEVTVRIDKTIPAAPQITLSSPDGQAGWYHAGSLQVIPTAQDSGSPIQTEYSVDGGSWQNYSSGVFDTRDGAHSYRVRAVDAAGNISPIASVYAEVDNTSPTISSIDYVLRDGSPAHMVNGKIMENQPIFVRLVGYDNLSGLRSIVYQFIPKNGQPSEAISAMVTADGMVEIQIPIGFEGKIQAYAVDISGNEQNMNQAISQDIIINNESMPLVSIAPRTLPNEYGWYNQAVSVDLTAEDSLNGIEQVIIMLNGIVYAEYKYSDWQGSSLPYYLVLTGEQTDNLVEIIATNNLGNQSRLEQQIKIDKEVPQSILVDPVLFKEIQLQPDPDKQVMALSLLSSVKDVPYTGDWVKEPIYFLLGEGEVTPSGLAQFEYSHSLDGLNWSGWEAVSNPPSKYHQVTGSQNDYYRFRFLSKSGLYSQISPVYNAKIDQTNPEIPKIVLVGKENEQKIFVHSPDITLYFPEAIDHGSPVAVFYTITNVTTGSVWKAGSFTDSALAINNFAQGHYLLSAYSEDQVGNRSPQVDVEFVYQQEVSPTPTPTAVPTQSPTPKPAPIIKTGEGTDSAGIGIAFIMIGLGIGFGSLLAVKKRKRQIR